jgi:AraC-like DNA-binding protein
MGDDANQELAALYALITEANSQGNVDFEGHARLKLIFCYYNYNMPDSVEQALPAQLEFMAKHEQWDYYYNSWEAKVELFLYADKNQTALKEAQLMYDDAKTRNNNYGLGVSAHTLGIIYQTLQRYELAEKSFYEAIERLKKEDDISLRLNTYNTLCETLDADQKYSQMLPITNEWEATIDNYKRKMEERGITPRLNGRYLYCYLAQTVAHFQTGNSSKAKYYLDLAEECAKGRKQIAQFKLLHIKTRYFEHLQQFDKAIACADTNYQMVISFGDSISALTVLENKARILRKAGKGMDAALVYEHVMATKDSLRNLNMAAQLDELRTIYEVDRLILEKKVSKTQLAIVITISGFLLLILLGYIVYTVRLKRKNRILYEKIRRIQQVESQAEQAFKSIPEDTLSKEQMLFRALNNLLTEKQHFTNPKLGRKELADSLGTNTTYLAEAIKACANGMTVTEYLNRIRLVQAGNMLIELPQLPVDAVGEDCGFTSRSTYYRLFRDYYGMSPTEFRNIAKEKSKRAEV